MSTFYEDTLLRQEYNLVVKLQQDMEFSKYVTVSYEDRITGEERRVTSQPNANKYPEKYIVNYRMPVYVKQGQLRQDWHGKAIIQLSEPVLTNRDSYNGPYVTFESNFEPFNNHVHQCTICSGNAWAIAKDNGLWHFIISIGALINQDEYACAEGSHFNGEAYQYWVSRGRKPVTVIKWPFDLLNRVDKKPIIIIAKPKEDKKISEKPKIHIVSKQNEPKGEKDKITIIPKSKTNFPEIKIIKKG